MKKVVLFTVTVLSLSLFLTGCATTKGAEQKPAPEDTQGKETTAQEPATQADTATEQQPATEQQAPTEEATPAAEPEQDVAVEDEPVVLEPVAPEEATFTSEPEPVEEENPVPALSNDEDIPILIEEPSEPETINDSDTAEHQEDVSTTADTNTAPVVETEPSTVDQATTVPTTTSVEQTTTPSTTAKPATAQTSKPLPQTGTTTVTKPIITTAPRTNAGEVETIEIPADEAEPTVSSETSSVVAKNDGVPSRSVTILTNQYLDVIYPGTGWVYLGEANGASLMKYFGRKIGTTDTSFSLRSSKAGDTVLHFYKNDILTGEYIDDYLAVTVQNKRATSTTHITAPSYAEYVPPRLDSSSAKNNASDNASTDDSTADSNTTTSAQSALSSKGSSSKATNSNTASNGTSSKNNGSTAASSLDDSNVQTVIQTTESSPTTTGSSTQNTSSSRSVGNNSTANSTTSNSTSAGTKASSSAQQSSVSTTADTFGANASATNTAADATTSTLQDTTNLSSDDILSLAQKSFDNKKYRDTLTYLDAFFDKAVTRVDEGLYLQGRTLESNSEVRNIKSALDTYESLVKNYPQSIDWEKANERITYLKRFYFNIR